MSCRRWLRAAVLAGILLLPARMLPAQMLPDPMPSAGAPDIRAHLRSRRSTELSSEIAGKVEAVTVAEGESFNAGDRLVAFDCAIHRAQLAKVAAAREAARRTYAVRSQLGKLRSASALEVDEAAANLAMAEAEERSRRIMVERCAVIAPFSGRAGEVKVKPHQFVAEGKELLEIVDDRDLELEMIVPSRWLVWLQPGQIFAVELDENGRRYPAEVTRLAAGIDPVSQSIKVFARIAGATEGLLPGMSGRALFVP